MKFRFSRVILISIVSVASTSHIALCMESIDTEQVEKLATVQWLKERIEPLNAGRFKTKNIGAQSNCTLVAEKCVRVLAGLEEPSLVPAHRKDLNITCGIDKDEDNAVVYHEVHRREQAELVPTQEFIETIDLLDNEAKGVTTVDLTQLPQRDSVKYRTTTRSRISEDIQNLPGSAASCGKDKTLTGLIYYYYTDADAGHLANFFRDSTGNVFFVDAQSEEVTQTVPEKVLNYKLKDEVFFYPVVPQSGYYIKKEFTDLILKEEPVSSLVQERENQATDIVSQSNQDLDILHDDYDDSDCNKVLSNADKSIHKKTHTVEKRYVCNHPDCGKGFTQSGHLNRHKEIHTGEKRYKCDYDGCNKNFTRADNLTQHKRRHTGERPSTCGYPGCNKNSITNGELNQHKRIHTGERPYVCNYPECGKGFTQSGHLKEHKRIHTGEKRYNCDYDGCDKTFPMSSKLKRHEKTHTGEKLYKCGYDGCDKFFTQPRSVKRHKETHMEERSSNKFKKHKVA